MSEHTELFSMQLKLNLASEIGESVEYRAERFQRNCAPDEDVWAALDTQIEAIRDRVRSFLVGRRVRAMNVAEASKEPVVS